MMPSPAERYYIELAERQRQIAWHEAAVAQTLMFVHAHATALATKAVAQAAVDVSVSTLSDPGDSVQYLEEVIHIPSLTFGPGAEGWWRQPIDSKFGTALSVVAMLTAGRRCSGGTNLCWMLQHSLDGEHWTYKGSIGNNAIWAVPPYSSSFHGPFADRLRVTIGCRNSDKSDDYRFVEGVWEDVRLTLGVVRM